MMKRWTKKALIAIGAQGLVCPGECGCSLYDLYACTNSADEVEDCEPGILADCATCDPDQRSFGECDGPGEGVYCVRPMKPEERITQA